MAALTDEEACALAHVLRIVSPEALGVDSTSWYSALDKISPQLPESAASRRMAAIGAVLPPFRNHTRER